MVRKHDKHEKARGKDRKEKENSSTAAVPKLCGCSVPDPVICSIGIPLPSEEDGGILMECSNAVCPFKENRIHPACFTAYEDHLVKIISQLGSARGWTDSQRRANLWEKKGQSLVAKVCRCRCGLGTTRRDEMAFYKQEQKRRQAEELAAGVVAGAKKKGGKTKALPKLNFGLIRGTPAAHAEERESRILTRRLNSGRHRDESVSSVSSTTYDYERRESLTYGVGCLPGAESRALSVMSGNVADHDDTMSTCSRDVFAETPVDLVPAPLPPPQTRSYASAIKRSDSPLDVESTPLSIETDLCMDSGVEMKSGSSTGSEGYESVKEPLSPSPTMEQRGPVIPQMPPTPSTVGSKKSAPLTEWSETPKSNRTAKQRKPMSFEMSLSLFQPSAEDEFIPPSNSTPLPSITPNVPKRKLISPPPGLEDTVSQLLTPAISPSTASFRFPDLPNKSSAGDSASTLLAPASDAAKNGNDGWCPMFGKGFNLGETLLAHSNLPAW